MERRGKAKAEGGGAGRRGELEGGRRVLSDWASHLSGRVRQVANEAWRVIWVLKDC